MAKLKPNCFEIRTNAIQLSFIRFDCRSERSIGMSVCLNHSGPLPSGVALPEEAELVFHVLLKMLVHEVVDDDVDDSVGRHQRTLEVLDDGVGTAVMVLPKVQGDLTPEDQIRDAGDGVADHHEADGLYNVGVIVVEHLLECFRHRVFQGARLPSKRQVHDKSGGNCRYERKEGTEQELAQNRVPDKVVALHVFLKHVHCNVHDYCADPEGRQLQEYRPPSCLGLIERVDHSLVATYAHERQMIVRHSHEYQN